MEFQLTAVISPLEKIDELATKHTLHDSLRNEKLFASAARTFAMHPVRPIATDSTARYDTMKVGMKIDLRSPRMQDGQHADFGAQMLRVGSQLEQRLGRRSKQDAVDDSFILNRDRPKFSR